MTTAWMPISVPSPTVQPCSIAWCPIEAKSPIVIGQPGSTCRIAPSWMLTSLPITIGSLSPRIVAYGQTLVRSPSFTLPITVASFVTYADSGNCGASSPSWYRAILGISEKLRIR